MREVVAASQAIRCGDAEAVLAGGMESLSNAPHLLDGARTGVKAGDQTLVDAMIHDSIHFWPNTRVIGIQLAMASR